jgi:malonate transporter
LVGNSFVSQIASLNAFLGKLCRSFPPLGSLLKNFEPGQGRIDTCQIQAENGVRLSAFDSTGRRSAAAFTRFRVDESSTFPLIYQVENEAPRFAFRTLVRSSKVRASVISQGKTYLMSMTILDSLVPVFFVLGLGYFAGLIKMVDNKDVSSINTMLMTFALPAALFAAIARTSAKVLVQQDRLVISLALAMVLIYAITWVLQRYVYHLGPGEAAVQSLTVAFANNVAVGIPLLSSFFGSEGLVAVAAGIGVGAIVISPVTLVVLESGTDKAKTMPAGERLLYATLQSCKRPVVWAPVAGMIFSLLRIPLPDLAFRMLNLIGVATAGVALFLTGLILSAQPFRLGGNAITGVVLKNIGQVALMVLIVRLIGTVPPATREAVLLSAVPAGFFGTVFGARYGVASIEASSTLIASTLFSAVTLPIVILLTERM